MSKEPIKYEKFRGKSPARPSNAEAALQEIVQMSEAWIRRYSETWMGVSDKELARRMTQDLSPVGVLETGEPIKGPSLVLAIDATRRLAKVAKELHTHLVECRDESDKPAKSTKRAKRK